MRSRSPGRRRGRRAKAARAAPASLARRRCGAAWAVPPLGIGRQAVSLAPYHAGLAGRHPTRLLGPPAFPPCSCPLWLAPSGASDGPAVSLRTALDCVKDSVPRRTLSPHPAHERGACMVTSMSPGFHQGHGVQRARSLGTFVPFPDPLPEGLRHGWGFPTLRLLCPICLPAGPRRLRCGSPLPPLHAPAQPLPGSPVCAMADAHGTREVACCSPCPVRAWRLPRLCTEGRTGWPL